jgi:zinc protease
MSAQPLVLSLLLLAVPPAWADQSDIQNPPPPAEPRGTKLPVPVEKTLPNGLRVIVVERPGLPLLSAEFMVRNGAELDPVSASGAMEMLSSLLMRGTGGRSAPQLAQAIEALGATIDTAAGWDMSSARLTIMSPRAASGLQILSDVVRRPSIDPAEVERLRAETLDALRVKMEEPGTLARATLGRLIFGDGPYAHPLLGTPESVARVTRAQLGQLHAACYRPDNAALIFAGDLTPAQGFAWAEKYFGDWKNPGTPLPAARPAANISKGRVVIVDMPQAGQAAVLVGREEMPRTAPDYFPGLVASSVLGGGYSARLNEEVRVKRGLTYGASSELAAWRHSGCLVAGAQTKNSAAVEVATLIRAELDRLGSQPVPTGELAARTSTLTGSYGRSLETNDGFVTRLAGWAALGIPLSTLQTYPQDILAVTPAAVQAFAAKNLQGADACVVIAGNADSFRAAAGETFKDALVIPQSELNLESPNLRSKGSPH